MSKDICNFIINGKRCSNEKSSFSNFCTEHKNFFDGIGNQELIEKAAEYNKNCLYVTKEKKIAPKRDIEMWGGFTNCLNELSSRGYTNKEIKSAIANVIKSKGLYDEINQELGKDPKWKKFEKITAGIHFLKAEGAEVKYNDSIKGKRTGRTRQIDVSLKFMQSYYEYLAIVECKDLNKKVPISDVEAFRTKMEDVGAQKGIMVSTIGFQEGANKTAQAYNIELYTLTTKNDDWTRKIREEIIRLPFHKSLSLDTPPIPRPKENFERSLKLTEVLLYEDEHSQPTSLGHIVADVSHWAYDKKISLPCIVTVRFKKEMFTKFPGTDYHTPVYGVEIELVDTQIKFSHEIDLPPNSLNYIYSDLDQENKHEIPTDDIPTEFDTILEPGKFYSNKMKMNYRCNKIEGNNATMMLLENQQQGEIVDIEFVQDVKYGCYYTPLTDPIEIEQLEKRYQSLKKQ